MTTPALIQPAHFQHLDPVVGISLLRAKIGLDNGDHFSAVVWSLRAVRTDLSSSA